MSWTVTFNGGEPIDAATLREVEMFITGLALGLGSPIARARDLGRDARGAARASAICHQWVGEGLWARIDRKD